MTSYFTLFVCKNMLTVHHFTTRREASVSALEWTAAT